MIPTVVGMIGTKELVFDPKDGRCLVDQQPCAPRHTQAPSGYCAFFDWAEEMATTHRQIRCPDCGLWAIWVPK